MWLRPARRSSRRLRRPPPRLRAAARRSRRSATQYPVRPAGRDSRETAEDAVPGSVESERRAEEPERLHPWRHVAAKVRAHRAAPIAAEVDLTDERRRDEHRWDERDHKAWHKQVTPEEINRDDRERQGVFATSLPAKNESTHSTSKVPRFRTPRSCIR